MENPQSNIRFSAIEVSGDNVADLPELTIPYNGRCLKGDASLHSLKHGHRRVKSRKAQQTLCIVLSYFIKQYISAPSPCIRGHGVGAQLGPTRALLN